MTTTKTRKPNFKTGDWFKILNYLIENPQPDQNDWHLLSIRAGNWPTCACGQLCKQLDRNRDSSPTDRKLNILGMTFSHRVDLLKWKLARKTLVKIEKRTSQLLKETPNDPRTIRYRRIQ